MLTYCILHYKNLKVTKDCVNSLIKTNRDENDYAIIIIDNGSNNGSGEELSIEYKDNPLITVLIDSQNHGFAKGNNIAYSYAKNIMKSDIIVVMNSDILVGKDFSAGKIRKQVESSQADIISPDIITSEGIHQSPLAVKPHTIRQDLSAYIKNLCLIILFNIPVIKNSLFEKYSLKKNKKISVKKNIPIFNRHDFIPHGACIIYSNRWIETEAIAFVPKTFLYAEEDFLYEYAKKKNFKIFFTDLLKIKHLGSNTVQSECKTGIKTLLFRSKEQNKSLFKLIRYKLTKY